MNDDELREEVFYEWKDLEERFKLFKNIVQNDFKNVSEKDYERYIKDFEHFSNDFIKIYKSTKKLVKRNLGT